MTSKKGDSNRSRMLPGQPIDWAKFFATKLGDRDLRVTFFNQGQAREVRRGPFKDMKENDLGLMVTFWKWSAVMQMEGSDAGRRWRRDSLAYAMYPLGNRPRLLEDGRILLHRRDGLMIELLAEGDLLDPTEIRH